MAGILAVTLVSYVFASSTISNNGGNPVTLGSGVVAVTSCDDSIKFDLKASFQDLAEKFKVTSLSVSDIATSAFSNASGSYPGCAGSDMRINFYHKATGSVEVLDCEQLGYTVDSDISEGIDLANQLRRFQPGIAIILLTAFP